MLKISKLVLGVLLGTIFILFNGCTPKVSQEDLVDHVQNEISSATVVGKEDDAKKLDIACKTFIASVTSGALTSDGVIGSYKGTPLPKNGDSMEIRNEIANNLLVKDACEYNGLTSIYYDISDFGYINGGTSSAQIVYKASTNEPVESITKETKISDIYGKMS